MIRDLWKHRELIEQLTRREIQQRYKGSYLGVLWSFVTPALMLTVYTFVFSAVFRARWGLPGETPNPGEYALTAFMGLIPFHVLSECLARAPGLVLNNPNFVKKVVFPLEILPVTVLGSAVVHSLVSVCVVLAAMLLLWRRISPTVVFLPLAYVPLVLLALGLGWFVASLGVYIRDIGHGITVVNQVLFFLTPIFYPETAVPEGLRLVLLLNPFTAIVNDFRRTVLWVQLPEWRHWIIITAASAAVMLAGYLWFMKTKKGFADVM